MSHYIANTDADRRAMLERIGVASIDDLFADIPAEIRQRAALHLPPDLTEMEVRAEALRLSGQNVHVHTAPYFLGGGSYDHYIPSAVPFIVSRSEFFTAYTPYQAEASQGTLQVIYEFQTMVCQLTGMEMANASLYDGASALAEAVIMAWAIQKRPRLLLPRTLHPHYRQVVATYTQGLPLELVDVPYAEGATDLEALRSALDHSSAVVVQHPNFFGCLEDVDALSQLAHERGALLISVFDPISLGILKPPGAYDADIAVAEGQPLGLPPSFGGPYLGLFACKKQFARQAPGRIVGATHDDKGRRGFVLTLQTREQHIRREKATSNICTNQGLMALAATVYLSLMGKHGLRRVAELCLQKAHYTAQEIGRLGNWEMAFKSPFFKEFVVRCPEAPVKVNEKLRQRGIIGGLPLGKYYPELSDAMLLCVTEKRTKAEIDKLVEVLGGEKK
jgi:glycine dehydrogenase subunit 1